MLKTITYKGGNVSYRINKKADKKSAKNVILLHGFIESKETWKLYHKELSKSHNTISIDLLGHGETDSVGYIHTMEEMAEAVKLVIKEESIRKAFIVGHSMGGYVALAFCEMYPDNVAGLCLFNSTAKADSDQKKLDRDRAIKVIKKNHEIFIKEAITNLFSNHENRAKLKSNKQFKETLNIALKTPKQGIIAALEGMKIRDEREIIIKFAPYKILYIIGKNDPLLPYNNLIEQSDLSENASYYLSEKGGHLCFIEDTYPCLDALLKFINGSKKV